jgi:hypothetical protein
MKKDTVSVNSFGQLSVLDEHGEQVKLASLWKEKTGVLVFVRHFG